MDLIRFIFSCFGIFANTIYSLHIHYKIFSQIRIQIFKLIQNKYTLKQIFASERIFASKYLFWTEYLQNFKRIFTFKRIFASIFINFACKICRFASIRNKQIKPVLFAPKQINIRLYLLRTEYLRHTLVRSELRSSSEFEHGTSWAIANFRPMSCMFQGPLGFCSASDTALNFKDFIRWEKILLWDCLFENQLGEPSLTLSYSLTVSPDLGVFNPCFL